MSKRPANTYAYLQSLTPEQRVAYFAKCKREAATADLIRNTVIVIVLGAAVVATLLGYLDLFGSLFSGSTP